MRVSQSPINASVNKKPPLGTPEGCFAICLAALAMLLPVLPSAAQDSPAPVRTESIYPEQHLARVETSERHLSSATGDAPPKRLRPDPELSDGFKHDITPSKRNDTPTAIEPAPDYTRQVHDANETTISGKFDVTVDKSLSFTGTVSDQVYDVDTKITDLILPAAQNGTLPYTYSLSPSLPTGLTFDSSTRTLSGTPTVLQNSSIDYTYKVVDGAGDEAELTFGIRVKSTLTLEGIWNITDQSYTQWVQIQDLVFPVPKGGRAPLTYRLYEVIPGPGNGELHSGLTFDPATRTLSGTPTEAATKSIRYSVGDALGSGTWRTFTIKVVAGSPLTVPAISDKSYVQNQQITTATLPVATGGTAPYTYTLSPTVPTGLAFNGSSRSLSGTPTVLQTATTYTYTAQDATGRIGTQTFSIEVTSSLSFAGTVADQVYDVDTKITDLILPAAQNGTLPYTYSLSPSLPTGLTFTPSTRTLSGTPTVLQNPTDYTYKVVDGVGSEAELTFSLRVKSTLSLPRPWGISDQSYTQYVQIQDLVFPEASGGRAPLAYTLKRVRDGSNTQLPAGLTFDPATRTLSGTPTEAIQPSKEFRYTVTDELGSASWRTLQIEVAAGSPLTVPAISDKSFPQSQRITNVTLPEASGGTAPYTYTVTPTVPTGLAFDGSSRMLSGTPTVVQAATNYTYTAKDATGRTGTQTFSIEVTSSLAFTGTVSDQFYTQNHQITDLILPAAQNGTLPYTYTLRYTDPSLFLNGLSFDPTTGTISGTPTAAKTAVDFTWEVEDADGTKVSQTFDITVNSALAMPGTIADQVYKQNQPISPLQLPLATGGTAPVTYIFYPAPPQGLQFINTNTTRGITGTPTAVQPATNYTYTAQDANGATTQKSFSIEVTSSLALSSIADQAYTQNHRITDLVLPSATAGTAPYAYSLSGPSLPNGLTFNPATRTISGTPTATASALQYKWEVEDSDGTKVSQTFDLTVNSALSLGSVPDQIYTRNHQITDLILPSATGGTAPLTYSLTPALPSGLSFDAITRTLSGTPTAVQVAKMYTYQVEDANGAVESTTFDLTVNAALSLPGTISNLVYKQNHPSPAVTHPAATGGTTPVTYRIYPSLPQGLSFNAAMRTISGTATVVQAATTYTYEARDANGATASTTFSIEVTSALAVGAISDQVYTQNQQVTNLVLPAATAGTAPYTYTLSPGLPSGLSFDAITRTLSGTPTGVQVAKTYTYEVKDADGTTVSAAFDITVRSSLALPGSIASQIFVQNRSITPLTLPPATGGTAPYTYSLAPVLQQGLSFDATTRRVSGTPTRIQAPTNYTYRVQDADGTVRTATFTIEVKAALVLQGAIANQVYTRNLPITNLVLPPASGGTLPYTYSVTPALPSGLSFDAATRTLSGAATTVQPATPYTYQVQDGTGVTTSQAFTIAVVAADVLVLPAVPDQVYAFGETVSFDFGAARGGVLPHRYSLSPSALPQGLTYDNTRLRISGTAQAAMTPREYTFTVSDAAQQSVSHTFSMEVLMTLAAIEDQQYVVGQAIADLELPASGGGTDPHVFELGPELPAGLIFDAATRTLAGTPLAGIPRTPYTYTVTDVFGVQASQTFDIEVRLALAPIEDQSFIVGEAIPSTILPAADGGQDPHVYTLTPEPPSGLAFNAATRTLSGTPQELTVPSSYRYHVSDSSGAEADRTFTMEVVAAVLQLPPVADQQFVVGSPILPIQLPAATGGVGPHRYRLSPDLPPGVVFEAATRTLGGTPTTQSQPAAYTYTVEDAGGETSSQTFRIQVHAALALPPIADQQFAIGRPITPVELPSATGGLSPYSYSLTPDPVQGLSFDAATRTLSGTPTEVSAPQVYTYLARDTVGHTAEQSFEMAVYGAFSLSAVEDQVYEAGMPIADIVLPAAFGGTAPYTYRLSPAPPPGLTFDAAARTLSGTPTSALAQTVHTYTATDAAGVMAAESFYVEVRLGLASIEDQTYQVGTEIAELQLPSAVGGSDPHTYRLSPELPSGLVFDANARTLNGTPTMVTAQTTYTYDVTDAAGFARSQDFSITVEAQALALASIPDQTYAVDEQITPLQLPAAIGGQPPYDYVLSPAPPPGLTFDAEQRTLSGTPAAVMEETTYTYEVTDQDGATARQVFTMAVGTSSALLGDRAALIALYKATDGPNWTNATNWLEPPEEVVTFTAQQLDAWYGVGVSGGRVRSVELPVNNLQGALPAELGNLTALARLQLPGNGLEGTIPVALEHLRTLRQMHLQNNQLGGGVPEELGNLTALEQLWLFGNNLSGTIPTALSRLANMEGLLLSDNQLTGTIPAGLGGLADLQDLWLQGNQLSGTIPSELGQLDSLRTLLLNDNALSGAIPPVLGSLTYLRDLWLHSNDLTGAIPSELGGLDSLRGLLLNDNQLTDTIPSVLGDLSGLQWLHLQENALRGEIPPSLGQLTRLEQLQLSGNSLSGPLPHTLGRLTMLEYLYVHENALSGSLPATLVDLVALKELFFDGPIQELCAPTDTDFSTWLASLAAVRGPDCGASALSFETPVLAKSFLKGKGGHMALPAAEGGQAPYKYTLHPEPPTGLTFDAEQRTLSGTPVDTVSNVEYAYVAVDELGRKGKVNFTITVLPRETALLTVHGNYPNPFRASTNLNLSLASDADISVEIFDLLGRRVLSQETRPLQAGRNQPWPIDGLTAGSGMYLYRVTAATKQETQMRTGRMMVIK